MTTGEPIGRDRSDSVSINILITSEKRKKSDDSMTEEESNERPPQKTSKKKEGWLKGQPRKLHLFYLFIYFNIIMENIIQWNCNGSQ